ncbi:MAG: NADH-quinone oxidoreductase subunit N [Bacteroidetes bacterium]|nr:NADH-quinone oxidoreductase subunit N [Bacteroidota bacterium]HQW46895.1 NADH-quinone oxidoreductase subunit N [Chitinophagaceae bacterium]
MNAIVVSALLGVLMMFSGLFFRKSKQIQALALVAFTGLLASTLYDKFLVSGSEQSFFGMIHLDSYSAWFNVLITACGLMYVLLFHKNIAEVGKNDAEYFALLFFILCGAYLLSSFSNLLIMFLGIEILSIPQYILAGSDKENIKSNEASLKYFLMGAFSTGILLMGITLLYGASGSFDIMSDKFTLQFVSLESMSSLSFSGIMLLIVAFGFKVSAAPMHFWTPDVYDGTPTAFTPFMATIVKVSVFLAFIKLFHFSFGNINETWQMTIAVMIILTLLIGNITAVYQQSVKRMMAYSSIAQAGFMLFAIYAFNTTSWKGLLLYSVVYTLASFGVFAAIIKMKDQTYEGFNGLAKRQPVLAATTAICLLSLAGIPLTGGFFAKYFLLSATVEQGHMIGIVIFAVLMAAISAYYYFKVIMSMYFKDGDAELIATPSSFENVLYIINAAILILLGLLPGLLLL